MTPVTEYIKNLGKSVKYTAVEYLGYNMPATKEFMESNEELFKDTYHAIANIRRTKNRFETAIKKTAVYDIADTAFTNAVDSFKTGRFNDPYRQSKADAESFGLDDFESGDMDMSMDNLSDSTSTGGSMDENTKAVLDSSANNAATVANAQFESAKYIAGVSKANTGLLFKQTLQMNQTLSAGFSGLNAGMDALNRFNTEVVQTLADNATKFFQNTTDILKENNAMFKEFLEMQRNLYKKEDTNTGKSHDLEDVMGINGSPNIKAYIKMITKNVKDELGEAVPGLDSMLENPEMIKSMLANPLSAIPGLMMSVAMGPMLKTSLKQFDDTISSIFGGFLAKMSFNANDENAPWYKQLMGKILGVKYLGKSSIDTRNTKNGPTPFDHQTKRAITEVIPGYLARIESGITGQPAKLYNDKTGKWTNIATVKKNFKQQQENAKLSGSYSLHSEMNKNMNDAKWDQKAIDAMTKVMEKIAKKRYSDNGHLEFFNGDLDKFADYYGLDENAARLYLALYGSTSRAARAQSASKILQSKLNQRKSLKYEESLGSGSVYRQLFTEGFDDKPNTRAKIFDRDSKGNIIRDQLGNAQMKNNSAENVGGVFNLNNMSDKYGSTVFDYLRSIDINTSRITGSAPTDSNHGPIHISDIIPNPLGSDNNSNNIIIGGSSTNAGGSPIILGPTGNIISGGQSSSDKSSTTNADKEEKEKKEKEVKMSDFKESSIMDMSHDITRVGAANQLKELKRRYEEENPNLANHIAELIDMVDELRDAAKNGERIPGQDEYKSEQGKKFLEATKELRKYMDYPGAALAGGVQAFNDSIYNFLYGTPEDFFKDSHEKMTELISEGDQREKPKGFFQAMYYGMNNMFDRIKDNLDMLDEEKQKSIWNKADAIIDGMLGFKMSDVLKSTKNAIVNNVGGAFKDVANDLGANKDSEKKEESSESSEEPPPESETETPSSEESKKKKKKRRRRKKSKAGHAEGVSTVTKSGMTFLSKGEIVIPNASEDQRELDAINEEKLRQKFINQAKHAQMFSEGGEAVDVDIDDWKAKGQSFMKGARNIASNIAAKFTDEANEAKAADSIYGRMKDILFGDSFKETQDTVKKVESEIKEKIPNVASGGILGTAAGSLIGGPLVGAVLGSALGIATNSETVQTALFGEKVMKDGKETGERNGSGLFSTEAQKTMKKYLPDMKKYGIVAGTIGMFTPFGLLGGALMGSAIGFMKNNESVQETLFGKDGLFDEDTQKTIKKYFPSAAKGGAGGLLLGLAGGLGGAPLLGVAALGAGIGLVTTTDEFKDEVLGKLGKDGKRHGGVLEEFKKETIGPFKKFGSDMTAGFKKWFKEDIADPVVKSIKPMGKEVGLLTKQGFKLAKEGIAKLLNSKTGIPLIDSIMNSKAVQKAKGAAGFLGGKAKNGTAWLLSRPSAMVGKLGDKLRASHIENGTADYMTAAERLEWMAANGKTDYAHKKLDEQLAGSSSAQLKQMQELFGTLQNGVGYYDDNIKNTRKGLGKAVSQTLGKGNGAVATEIMKLVNKGDLKGAQEVLDSSNITIAKKKSLAKIINDSGTALQEYEAKKKNYDDNREAKYEKLKKLGFTNISDDNLDNYQKLFSAEAKSRLKTEEAEKEMGEEDSIANQITSSLDVNFDAAIAEMQKTNELLSGILSGGTMDPADMKRIRKSNIAGRKAALKNDKAMNKLIRKRSNDISKKFGGAKLNDSTKNKIADNDKLYQNMRDFSKTRAGKLVDPNYVAGIKNEKLQDLYFSLAQKGYTIDNIDVLEKFDDDQIANLERLTEANMRIESLKDISKLDKKTTGYLVEMLKYPEMKKLTQKQLITIAKKSGARFVNDPIMRDKMLRAAKKHGKDFTGKIDEDNLKLGPIPKKKKKKSSAKKSSTKEEAPKEETPEIQSHAFGGLALLDGLSTVSKGETILNLGKSAVKHAGNWAKNKAKERLMNSSAGKAYQSATNLKAKVSGNTPKSAPSGTTTKDTEYGALTYTKGANGKQVLANTKENVMVQKAMAKKDAVQQDISDTMHKLLEVNQQIADNTTPPGADKKGGGLLGTILGLLGTFLFNKFKKAWKFLKDGFGIVSKGVKGLAAAVGSIGSIATKIGEATAKAGELVKTLSKPMESISKAFGKTSGLFKKLAKIGNAVKGKKGLAAIAAAGVAAYEIGFSDNDDGEDKKEGESKPGETPDDGGKEPTPTPGPGEPPPGQPPEKPANTSLGGAAAGAATGAMALYGANRLSNTSFFRNDPKSTGMMSKLGKAFGAYSAYDTVSSAYDFATASTDDKLKMLNKWNDKSLLDKGLDVMGYATGIGFMKDMGGKALSMIRNGGQAAEAAGEAAGAANKFEWAKDITDKGKDLVEKGKGAIGETAGKIAEQAGPIIEKVKTAFNTVTEKISKFVSEKYSKGIIKLKDFIIKKLTNPAVIKKVLKEAGKLVGKAALAATGVGAIAVGALMAADVVSAFYQGFNNPIEILSLAQGCSPSLDMKMLSGVISAFWAGIPVCPIIFDDPKEFADVCIENIGPVVGITRASLDEESKKSEEEGSEMGGVFNDIKNGISNNIEYVKNGISNNAEYVKNGISNNIEYVKNGISNNAEYVKNGIINNAEWVKNKASEKWEAAKEFVGDKATKVGEAVDELGGKAKETINDGIDIAYQFYNGISTKANEVMDGLMAGIAKNAAGIAKFVGEGFASIGKGISNSVNSVLSNIGKVGSSVIKSISNSAVGRAASTAYSTVKNFASGAYSTVKNFASGAYDKAKSVASSVGSAASSAWDSAKNLGSKALDAFKGSSIGRAVFGSGRWGRGDIKPSDIDSISSYEDCMELLGGVDINSIPEYNRPSSEDSITVLRAKAKAIISANSKKSGTGKWGRGAVSDANNSFHSQLDPINAMNFNASGDTVSQSMRDSGCGPVSAANIGAYFGKQIDSKDAASFALRKGYKEKNGGTKDGFFGDYLGQYGINTRHISTGNAKESLKNGKPVLLMGQDDSNSPILDASGMGKTPFGTNPHYVVATGLDKRGNMIIQDPESRTPNRVFKANDVLNKSSIAMDASNTGKGRWGRGDIKPADIDKISSYEDCMELLGGVDINSIPAYNRPSSEDSINVLKAKAKAIISSYGKKTGTGKWGTGPAVDEKPPFGSIAASIAQKVGSQHPELFWAQMMYETGGPDRVKKDIAKMGFDDYNYGGFTWYPGMGENYKGAPRPSNEGGYYAKFSSDAEYADMAYKNVYQSYADELKNAATPEDFAHILKEHGYYAADESDYAAGLKSILNGQYNGDLGNLGSMAASSGGPGKKYGGLFGAFDRITDTLNAILNGSDDSGGSSGNSSGPAGGLANGGVPGDTGLDYMLKNLPGAVVTSSYKDASGRPTPGEHGGIDIAAAENTPVPTPVNGVVEDAGSDSGYGNYVQVKDKNGNFHLFGHLNEQKVNTGDNVNKGTIIGLEGSTGHSTGPHVHYQIDPPSNVAAVKSGPHLDPATYSISGLGKFGLGSMKAKYGGAKWGMGEGAHIWEYLKNKGLGSSTIAGIMGNMEAESSLEPNMVEGGGHADEITVNGRTGYGLCQWTSQDRQQGLVDFAQSRGTSTSNTDTQLEYMLKEVSDGYGDLLARMDGMSPYDAALLFHKEFERSNDTPKMAARRGQFAEDIAKSEGKGETFNGTYSGSPSSGGPAKKYSGLFGAFERIADALGGILTGENSSGGPGAANNGGVAGGHSSDAGIQAASQWANSMVGQTGYGDNGCTAFVKNYLLKANNPVGQLMQDGSQGNLMYVPTLEDWAKKNNMFKDASQGGAEGDIAITNDHGHVTIADGDGGAWGNSSSQNKILHYKSIADAFGTPNGYVSTGSGKAAVSQGESKRSAAEMAADGGSSNGWGGSKWGTGNWLDILNSLSNASINNNISSMTNIPRGIGLFGNSDTSDGVPKGNAPKEILGHPYISDGVPKGKDTSNNPFKRINDSWNSLKKSGEAIAAIWNPRLRKKLNEKLDSAKPKIPKVEFKKISEDDINNIKNAEGAIALLKEASIPIDKIPDMNMPKDTDDLGVIRQKVRTIIKTIKPEAPVEKAKELVDGKYEKNDVDYLLNRGYTKEDAIALLAKDPKYNNGLVDGKYEKNDVDYLLNHGYTKEDAIALLAKDPKYNKKNAADIEKKTKETSFNLDTVKKKFQDRVKQMFHPESAKDSTNSKTSTTSSTQQTSTKTSVPTKTSAQQKAQEAQTDTATTNVIDYTEKFDTIISLLNIIAGNPLNTSAQTTSGNNTSVHMVNAKNTGNIRADELAKMFTNINNAMNNLASR